MSVTITVTLDGADQRSGASTTEEPPAPVEGASGEVRADATVHGAPPPDAAQAMQETSGSLGADTGAPPAPLDSQGGSAQG